MIFVLCLLFALIPLTLILCYTIFYVSRRVQDGDPQPSSDSTYHKSHIPCLMFTAAFGEPHLRTDGSWNDGKYGIWCWAEFEHAQR
jgi:hypothetical protein